MKNQLLPPWRTMALPVPLALAQVSYVQWMVLGVHLDPVRSAVAAPAIQLDPVLVLDDLADRQRDRQAVTSPMTSTPSWSIHERAMTEPMSALF